MEDVPYTKEKQSIEIKDVSDANEKMLQEFASFVKTYSWGEDYPESPFEEIKEAVFRTAAFHNDQLVGFGSITNNGSPDGIDNGELWLAHAVVLPEFQQQGIYGKIYEKCMGYASTISGRLLACTDNPVMDSFFLSNEWKKIREAKDVAGVTCNVYEYPR